MQKTVDFFPSFPSAYRLAVLSLAALSLSACSTQLSTLRENMPAEPQGFASALAAEYLSYAESEAEQGDRESAERFAAKGNAALRGETVAMEDPATWPIPEATQLRLFALRGRLVSTMKEGEGALVASEQSARAQLLYDCAVKQAARPPRQTPDMVRCEEALDITLREVEQSVQTLTEANREREGFEPIRKQVYFESGSSKLGKKSQKVIDEIAQELLENPHARVELVGRADREGSAKYNQSLSERRAMTVRTKLIGAGIEPERIKAVGSGEVRKQRKGSSSRRVDILVIADDVKTGGKS